MFLRERYLLRFRERYYNDTDSDLDEFVFVYTASLKQEKPNRELWGCVIWNIILEMDSIHNPFYFSLLIRTTSNLTVFLLNCTIYTCAQAYNESHNSRVVSFSTLILSLCFICVIITLILQPLRFFFTCSTFNTLCGIMRHCDIRLK